MLTNSCPTSMSGQPPGGQGRLCSMSQMPERSGLPSAACGAGALRLGRRSGVLGTPAVGYFNHCAERGVDIATTATTKATVTILIGSSIQSYGIMLA